MKILFLADPNSIHDIKWMSSISEKHTCFLLARKHHLNGWDDERTRKFKNSYNIEVIGSIHDFSIRHFIQTLKQWSEIRNIIKLYKIDVFHIMFAEPNALWAVFSSNLPSLKFVLTTRGTDVLKTIPDHLNKKDLLNKAVAYLYRKAFRKFDLITCTSYRQVINVKKLAPLAKVEVIRTGVDFVALQSAAISELPKDLAGKPYVLFPRNMQPLYNHEFSLAAIKKLPNEVLEEYIFVFVDEDSSNLKYVQGIKDLMKEIGENYFLFLPRQTQSAIWSLYKNASLVVMNPLSDGAPVSAMEAMALGCPIILGNLEYDEDIFGSSCCKLTEWDADQMAKLMVDILSNTCAVNFKSNIDIIKQKANRDVEMNRLNLLLSQ